MLVTPTTRDLCPSYVMAIAATVESLTRFGIRFDYYIMAGDCHVDDARNHAIRDFLDTECTDLFFLDSDVGWNSKDFIRILQVPGDIVAGIYPHKNDKGTYPFHPGLGERPANEHGLFEMPKVPTGFMRIRRPVLEALYKFEFDRGRVMHPQEQTSRRPMARIVERAFPQDLPFELPENTEKTYHSGDYVLCLKAQHLGFSVAADVECSFSHTGDKVWSGNLGDHLRLMKGIDHPDFAAAMQRLIAGDASLEVFQALVRSSMNPPYALPAIGLELLYREAKQATGPILECGSGLSTLVLAAAVSGTQIPVYTLEHDLSWVRRINQWRETYGLGNVSVIYAPLMPHENGDWYGITGDELPDFDLFLNDGPPRSLGLRAIALRVLKRNIENARTWILDDCTGEGWEEQVLAQFAPDRAIEWVHGTPGPEPRVMCVARRKEQPASAAAA